MIKVLFICLGNICRSPIAEFVFRDMVSKAGLEEIFHIESRATSREEEGNPVYPPAKVVLAEHGISCAGKTSKVLKAEDYEKFDYLIGMDNMNIRNIERITGKKGGKISKLLSFAGIDAEISDPWYHGGFTRTYEEVLKGCEGFLRYLREKGEI